MILPDLVKQTKLLYCGWIKYTLQTIFKHPELPKFLIEGQVKNYTSQKFSILAHLFTLMVIQCCPNCHLRGKKKIFTTFTTPPQGLYKWLGARSKQSSKRASWFRSRRPCKNRTSPVVTLVKALAFKMCSLEPNTKKELLIFTAAWTADTRKVGSLRFVYAKFWP